jgi:cadmium resistance protein CadD (predicted permease)
MSHSLSNLFTETVLAFLATNLDEFIVLVTFFARVSATSHTNFDSAYTNFQIFLGQFICFTIIIIFSLLGGCLGWAIPLRYISLLGLVPLFFGIHGLYEVCCFWCKRCTKKQKHGIIRNDIELAEKPVSAGYGTVEVVDDDVSSLSSDESHDSSADSVLMNSSFATFFKHIFHPNVVFVALVMLADGAEEIAVFTSLYATSTTSQVIFVTILFYVLILLQCLLAYQLTSCQYFASIISRYSKNIVPIMLLCLGVFVLQDSVLVDYLPYLHA